MRSGVRGYAIRGTRASDPGYDGINTGPTHNIVGGLGAPDLIPSYPGFDTLVLQIQLLREVYLAEVTPNQARAQARASETRTTTSTGSHHPRPHPAGKEPRANSFLTSGVSISRHTYDALLAAEQKVIVEGIVTS